MLYAYGSYLCFIFYAIRCCLAIVVLNDWPILIVLMLIRTGDSYANVNLQNEFRAEKSIVGYNVFRAQVSQRTQIILSV
mgnify:CR=1 FL=1